MFAGTRTPTLFGHPQGWVALLLEANRALAAGRLEAAAELRDQAFDQAPTVPGTADGAPFDWIADADPRLGPVLEAILDGTYYWLPLQHVAKLDIEPPVDLRDKVWLPASLHLDQWRPGGGVHPGPLSRQRRRRPCPGDGRADRMARAGGG